ncbi:hypothetical protein P885DRAFT_62301 [Corynascus similis CBS 632.67]
MFEVDWKDYDCERVGERRARKAIERKQRKEEDTSSGHRMSSTASSRASGSSDHYRHKFSGTIGKKRTTSLLKSQEPEAATPRLQSGEAYEEHTRGSVQISRALAASRILHKGNSLTRSKESHSYRSSPNLRPESMLSSITQLTIPTLEFRDDQSVTEATSIIRYLPTYSDGSRNDDYRQPQSPKDTDNTESASHWSGSVIH